MLMMKIIFKSQNVLYTAIYLQVVLEAKLNSKPTYKKCNLMAAIDDIVVDFKLPTCQSDKKGF